MGGEFRAELSWKVSFERRDRSEGGARRRELCWPSQAGLSAGDAGIGAGCDSSGLGVPCEAAWAGQRLVPAVGCGGGAVWRVVMLDGAVVFGRAAVQGGRARVLQGWVGCAPGCWRFQGRDWLHTCSYCDADQSKEGQEAGGAASAIPLTARSVWRPSHARTAATLSTKGGRNAWGYRASIGSEHLQTDRWPLPR